MIPNKIKKLLEKQQYRFAGKNQHSAVKICNWTKQSLRGKGQCYKEKFYGIPCHRCCQMTPAVMWCQNKCLHCWRAIEYSLGDKIKGEIDSPKEIIDSIIEERKKLLMGMKGSPYVNGEKFGEALEPKLFTFSLAGEPIIYEKIGDLIQEVRNRNAISFLVTNGLMPEKLKEIEEKNQLPTQLTISLNSPNKEMYDKWHNSIKKNAWKKFNQSLEIMNELKGKTRRVVRLTLARNINLKKQYVEEYAKLIKKANPDFIHVKAYMHMGFSKKRLPHSAMPSHKEIKEFSKELLKFLPKYQFLDEQPISFVALLGTKESKKKMKITNEEI